MDNYLIWLIQTVGNLKWYSIVHEIGSATVDYPHTHVAFQAEKRMQTRNPRLLDYQDIHPNIKPINNNQHAEEIVEYHQKAPVLIRQSSGCPRKKTLDYYDQIVAAPTFKEACVIAGVVCKTMGDVATFRTHQSREQSIPPLDTCYCWTLEAPANFTSLFVTGKTGTGKTRWAIHLFQSCLLVSHMEDLKRFMPSLHDGIVFDDMDFRTLTPAACIHLLDWEMPRTLNVKHGSVTIPARTRKVFTSNLPFGSCMPPCEPEHFQALMRRVQIIQVTEPLFKKHGDILEESVLTMGDADPAEDHWTEEDEARFNATHKDWNPLDQSGYETDV